MGLKDVYKDVFGSAGLSLPVLFRLLKTGSLNRTLTVFYNFTVNGRIKNGFSRQKYKNAFIPKSIIVEPAYRCNKNCLNCYIIKDDEIMSFDLLDSFINQARKLGIYRFEFMGGEPLMPEVQEVIIPIMKKYKNCCFSICTNCAYVNIELAERLKKIKNIAFLLSMEGTENATDSYRGEGSYNSYREASLVLKKYKIPFGLSISLEKSTWESQINEDVVKDFVKLGGAVIYSNPRFNKKTKSFEDLDKVRYIKELQRLCKKFPIYWGDGYYGKMKYYKGIIPRQDNQVCLDPKGNIRTNRFLAEPVFGNIKSKSLFEILSDSALISKKRKESSDANIRLALEKLTLEKEGLKVYSYQWTNSKKVESLISQ